MTYPYERPVTPAELSDALLGARVQHPGPAGEALGVCQPVGCGRWTLPGMPIRQRQEGRVVLWQG